MNRCFSLTFTTLVGIALVASLSLQGEAREAQTGKEAEDNQAKELLTLDQILSEQLGDSDYVDQKACINMDQVKRTEALDARHVVFKLKQNEYWIATLKIRCPGMSAGVPLQFEKRSRSICQGDSVRAPFGMTFDEVSWGPACNLSRFQSITPEQLTFAREALKAQRR